MARRNLPIQLRAEAHYLLGNLEFLRHEYRAAVAHYNRALELIPGQEPGQEAETPSAVGRDAAHNRALALRRAEEDKPKPPDHPDAGPPPEHSDAGPDPDQKDQDQKDQDKKDQDKKDPEEKKPDEPKDQPDQDEKDQDQQDQQQKQQDQQNPSPDSKQNQQAPSPEQSPDGQEEKKDAPPPPPHGLSLSQDDKALDQLERAPTVQQEAARAQRGRVRRVVEDK